MAYGLQSLEHRIPPPVVLLIAAAAMWGAAQLAPLPPLFESYRVVAAVVVACLGASVSVAGRLAFLRAKTTMNPLHPERAAALVDFGIYRFTRNPMYVGLLLILLGWGIFLANAWALAGLPVFALYITRFQIMPEERVLAEKFGAPYSAYCARVRRWL
jgi:protein-S-isoprenylcysteine O-methyltransferase Ste14